MNPKILTKHNRKYEKHITKAEKYIIYAMIHLWDYSAYNIWLRVKYYKKARKHFLKAKYPKNWYKNN